MASAGTMKSMRSSLLGAGDQAMKTEKDILWVGDIDGLPVIGTVREGVEWVLAVASGDVPLAKEKEQAIISGMICQKPVDLYSGGLGVKGIPSKDLFDYISAMTSQRSGQRGRAPQSVSAARKQEILEKTTKDVQQALFDIGMKLEEVLSFTPNRSKRGEHVFNNNILKIHSKIIEKASCNIKKGFYNKKFLEGFVTELQNIIKRGSLPEEHKKAIATEMVVDIDENEPYINSNSIVYGIYIKKLHSTIMESFQDYKADKNSCLHSLRTVVRAANNREVYVDSFAKLIWLSLKKGNSDAFQEVKSSVVKMFEELYETTRRTSVGHSS